MSVIGSNILAGASGQGGDYTIARSLRFRSSASAYLNRTPASVGNRKTWTWSAWVKRGALGADRELISAGSGSALYCGLRFTATDKFDICLDDSNYRNRTTQVFRDPSAWYHIVVAIDTTQSTSSNRVKMYVNGVQVTAFDTALYPTQNYDTQFNNTTAHNIGRRTEDSAAYLDGYMTEINWIDGQQLTPSSFGENNAQTGVWQPKRYAGTYGTNGFYLPFTDNSALTSGSNAGLGKDFSGNGNYWNTNNISITSGSTYDSMTDVPTLTDASTANYCVISPLDNNNSSYTLSNANLKFANGGFAAVRGTLGGSNAKFYFEILQESSVTAGTPIKYGIGSLNGSASHDANTQAVILYTDNGSNKQLQRYNSSGIAQQISFSSTLNTNDIVQVAYDGVSGKTWIGINNTWFDSSGGTTGNPSTGANPVYTLADLTQPMTPYFDHAGAAYTSTLNCGQRPFAYTPPTGYVALNTFNLPTPTIGATASTQANDYFNVVTYTGNGSEPRTITGVGFNPDMVWAKGRSVAYNNFIADSVRGANANLVTNSTVAETNPTTGFVSGGLGQVTTDGFTLVANGTDGDNLNQNSASYVAWAWKANGSGVTNTAGSITSTVSANTSAGFSVVTYTGNGSSGATVGHGLGVAPRMLIIKARDGAGYSWKVYHGSLGSGSHLELESTAAAQGGIWNSTNPSSTVFTLGTNAGINENGKSYVCYAFSEVAGYSKFGSYTGNGSSDGTFVALPFRPAYVMIKCTNSTGDWAIFDKQRSGYNVANDQLQAQSSGVENSGQTYHLIDLLSNGFKLRATDTQVNASGSTYIYMAIAETPAKFSLAR